VRLFIVQIFFLALIDTSAVEIVDLAGNKFSLKDGVVTELVFATTNEADRAQKVGDNTPDYCLGNPKYRMMTVLEFASHHSAPARAIINKFARRRADAAARNLQSRYDSLQLKREARLDVIVATDFDGAIAKPLEVSLGEHVFEVFVLNGKGNVVEHWSDVPARDALEAALRAAAQ
jgi:hypothetical protein